MAYRVVLVDDELLFREWLRSSLERSEDFEVLGEAGNGAECISLINSVMPDVVILDVYMPDWDGLELAGYIKAHLPDIKTILISAHSDRVYSRLAEHEGAVAFISKADLSITTLLQALQAEPLP